MDDDTPATSDDGWTFFEVSIHPFVQQIADEDGNAVEGDWHNPDDDLGEYPDSMFRKGWSVTSWARDGDEDEDGDYDGEIAEIDEEEFADFDMALVRAEELATKYRVDVDHRY